MEAFDDEKIRLFAVDDLLEERWFFGNSLVSPKPLKTGFARCYSDPCPSSSALPSLLPVETGISGGEYHHRSLVRAPSLPLISGREEEGPRGREARVRGDEREGEREPRKGKVLTRTQTLPPVRAAEAADREEGTRRRLSRSGRGASLSPLDILPPRHDKGSSRHRAPRSAESAAVNTNVSKDMRRRFLSGRSLRRTASELEIEEVQGFRDLGFTFDDPRALSPSVVSILPGLKAKEEESQVKRPYLSEAWLAQCSATPPLWAEARSSQDMKAQIKFWARSVASDVRLEC